MTQRIPFIYLSLLMVSILLGTFGQLSLKVAATHLELSSIKLLLTKNNFLFFGITLYAISLVCYVGALRQIPLSIAFPSISLGYIGVVLLSHWLFHEPVHPHQTIGLIMITLGVCFLWG